LFWTKQQMQRQCYVMDGEHNTRVSKSAFGP
jgi:hypothetical protein